MRHLIRFGLALLALAAIVGSATAETVVRVGVSSRDLGALDPAYGIGNGDEFPMRQIYNTLVSAPDGTADIRLDHLQGELAESWEMSPDARTFTFHLRKGVQWQRGYGEVTADDVAFTLQRMRDPEDRHSVFRKLPADRECSIRRIVIPLRSI